MGKKEQRPIRFENFKEVFKSGEKEISENPFFEKNKKQIFAFRGKTVERLVVLEESFNEIIFKMKPSVKIKSLRFTDRTDFIKKIVLGLDKDFKFLNKDIFNKLDRIYEIRHLFVHAPIPDLSKELFFKDKGMYSENRDSTKGNSVSELFDEFSNLTNYILVQLAIILQLILKKDEDYKKGRK